MPLQAGTRLGPYEIVSLLGAGGMGEVYRAQDARLQRPVAIKILPDALAADPHFRERFDREARTISQLAHPNICTLHDVGEAQGTAYLVMEWLAGETLAERLERAGGALPVEEALTIGGQIAEGLAAAHRAGIVHRDLKPANVFLARISGASGPPVVKLLDFGLAKHGVGAAAAQPGGVPLDVTASPTVSAPLTVQGTILGTFQYMPPEQIEGADADARADIWAFGCVLYEMITGCRAFAGKTQASLIGAILHAEPPPIAAVEPKAPAALDHLVRRCLAKNPDDRWQNIRDVLAELRWAGSSPRVSETTAVASVQSRQSISGAAIALVALAIAAVAAGTIAIRHLSESVPPAPTIRFQIATPSMAAIGGSLAYSPDGRALAFLAPSAAGIGTTLHVRATDSIDVRDFPQVRDNTPIAWSPDGRRLALAYGGKLRALEMASSTIQDLATIPFIGGRLIGLAWSPAGDIALTVGAANPDAGLFLMKAGAGSLNKITPDRDAGYRDPTFIDSGRAMLVLEERGDDRRACVFEITGARRGCVAIAATSIAYSGGWLLYGTEATIRAQRFDVRHVALEDTARVVADHAAIILGRTLFTAAAEGAVVPLFAYVSGTSTTDSHFVWADRTGRTQPASDAAGPYSAFDLSPSGRWVVAAGTTTGANTAWMIDLARGVATRSADLGMLSDVVWAPDERRFAWVDTTTQEVYEQPAFGGPRRLIARGGADRILGIEDWSRDGRYLALNLNAKQNRLAVAQPVDGSQPVVIVQARAALDEERFSPDGKWIAYSSDESGRQEVYIAPFPATGEHWQASTNGGVHPRWSGDGRELYYLAVDGTLMAARIGAGATPQIARPTSLFQTGIAPTSFLDHFAVSADGQRFLLRLPVGGRDESTITVTVNWTNGLARPAP